MNDSKGIPMTHFKATQPDGTDFYTGKIDYATALASGKTLKHPRPGKVGDQDASRYFSVATVATDCTSFRWPCRLFSVAPVGDSWAPGRSMPNKRAAHEIRIVEELPAWQVFGPRGDGVAAIMDRFETLTYDERMALSAARDDAWWAAWSVLMAVAIGGRADRAGLVAARRALYLRLFDWYDDRAAYGTALAVLFSGYPDLALSPEQYEALTGPWRKVIGKAHPKDKLPAKRAPRKVTA